VAVLVVEQSPVYRVGLGHILAEGFPGSEIELHDGRGGIEALLSKMDEVEVECLVLDRRALFGLGSTATVVDVVLRVWPGLGIVVVFDQQVDSLVASVRAGARGAFSREGEIHEFARIAREVSTGGSSFSSELARHVMVRGDEDVEVLGSDLSLRELDVVAGVVSGWSNRKIGEHLGISPHTVRNHLQNINNKLGAGNRTELAMIAIRQGLVTNQ
jgi:DNA-binding NarL/FixJ family response regulator